MQEQDYIFFQLSMKSYGSYNDREAVQAEATCSHNDMDRRGVVAVVVGVDSIYFLLWHASALALVDCAGSLVVVHMAEENQIHLFPHIKIHVKQTGRVL